MSNDLERRISYQYPFFESYVEPNGALTIDRACHACFYYGMLAQKAIDLAGPIDSQVLTYKVGEAPPPWFDANLANIARGVATMYALESPEDFLKFRANAWQQMTNLGIAPNDLIFRVTPNTVLLS